jgi:hypothetical protein
MEIGPLTAESHPRQEGVQCLDDRLYEYNASQPWLTMDSGSRSLSAMPADHVCRDQRLGEDHPRHHRNYYLRKRLS